MKLVERSDHGRWPQPARSTQARRVQTVLARAICGDTPEIARAVEAIEIKRGV